METPSICLNFLPCKFHLYIQNLKMLNDSNIHIRPGELQDLDQIIHLLKSSLGEKLLPKTREFWIWKHHQNPFGKSPVLVAETNGELVGIRTFLRWEFENKTQSLSALRAVDTAIHPAFQGRGLFTQLTLQLIELEKNNDLIFNTPNQSSLPGYEKMGWTKWGKLPVKLKPVLFPKKPSKLSEKDWGKLEKLINHLEKSPSQSNALSTKVVSGYLKWRYKNNPLIKYSFLSDEDSFVLFYRIKKGSFGLEMRITDFFKTDSFNVIKRVVLNRELDELIRHSGVRWVTFSGLSSNLDHLDLGLLPSLKIGPLVTLRNLNPSFDFQNHPWNWSLGDLELF